MVVYRPLPCDKLSPCCSWVTIAMKRLWLKSKLLFAPRSGVLSQGHLGTEHQTGLLSACCWCLYFILSDMYLPFVSVTGWWLFCLPSNLALLVLSNLPVACSLLYTQIGKEESIQCWEAALWGSQEVSLWLYHCSSDKLCCALSRNWTGSKDRSRCELCCSDFCHAKVQLFLHIHLRKYSCCPITENWQAGCTCWAWTHRTFSVDKKVCGLELVI